MIQPNKNLVFVPTSNDYLKIIHLTTAASSPRLITSTSNSLATNSNPLAQQLTTANPQPYLHLLQNQPPHLILTNQQFCLSMYKVLKTNFKF